MAAAREGAALAGDARSDQIDEGGGRPGIPRPRSAQELQRIVEIERTGTSFLLWRDASDVQRIFVLDGRNAATVGRRSANDVALTDDPEVSRTHAQLELIGGDWLVTDLGPSRNGTYVDGVRITERRRLRDGDALRFGQTVIEFRRPADGESAVTIAGARTSQIETLSTTQRRVLVALCRPYASGSAYATPASNQQIAAELFLGVDAVKRQLRILFQKFEIAELPQNQKRVRLVECAFQWGLVSEREL